MLRESGRHPSKARHGGEPDDQASRRCWRTCRCQRVEKDEIARIARGTRRINAARSDILFSKGDVSTSFHLVVYRPGRAGVLTSPQGGEKVVEHHRPGPLLGEAVMFMDKPSWSSRRRWPTRCCCTSPSR